MYRTEPRWWTSLWLRAVAIWCLLAVAAAFNGMLREVVLAPALGPRVAEPLSALLLAAVILFAAWWLVSLTFPCRPAHQWFLVGLLWAALTLALEIGFFHYGMGVPWEVLRAEWDPRHGGWFGLVLLVTLFAPPVFGLAYRPRHDASRHRS